MKITDISDFLADIYQRELAYYKELLDLTYRQNIVIKEEDLDGLKELLESKDKLMAKIDRLEEEVIPYKEKVIQSLDLNQRSWLVELKESNSINNRLKAILNQLFSILEELISVDKQNQDLLKENQAKLMKDMNKVKKGAKINNSYNNKPTRIHSTFIDNKR